MDWKILQDYVTKIIYVKGNLVNKSKVFSPKEVIQSVKETSVPQNDFIEIHEGDFILEEDNNNYYLSYLFFVKGNYISYANCILPDFMSCIPIQWDENLYESRSKEILTFLQEYQNDDKNQRLIYKMCFAQLFSIYEGLMIQDLLYLIRAKPKKILDLVKLKGKSNDDIIFQKEREVINYFLRFQGFYPKQESIKKTNLEEIFGLFGIQIPKDHQLIDFYHKRNDIVHRNGVDLQNNEISISMNDITTLQEILNKQYKQFMQYLNQANKQSFNEFFTASSFDGKENITFEQILQHLNIEK